MRRGILNTRARDFYDLYVLCGTQPINDEILRQAILATAEKRNSSAFLPDKSAILDSIRQNDIMRQRWNFYCKEYPYANGIVFDDVMDVLEKI